jgi:hypothetical protein
MQQVSVLCVTWNVAGVEAPTQFDLNKPLLDEVG